MTAPDESPSCSRCGGVFHPATGAEYGPSFRACGPCERAFWIWARGRLHWLETVEKGHRKPDHKAAKRAKSRQSA